MLGRFFYPKMIVEKVQDIDLETLRKHNIKALLLDIDNTLVPNHVKDADENAVKWIERVKASGFKACIVSNASKKRVVRFNEKLKLYAIHRASKPGTAAFKKALRLIDMDAKEAAVVGDQVFTDVYGGNKLGMFTILVKPIDAETEFVFVKFKRFFEKIVLASYEKNRTKK